MEQGTLSAGGAGKACRIKWLVTDCDGVLTDNGAYYSADGVALKRFSIRDGLGVERLRAAGLDVAIITGEDSASLRSRAASLGILELHQGVRDKEAVFRALLERYGLDAAEAAYIGDDVNDAAVLQLAGFSACPSDAFHAIRPLCDYVCGARGGHGAFREVVEVLLAAR